MKHNGMPAAERLRPTEKLVRLAQLTGDLLFRAAPCLSYQPAQESRSHFLREQIKELEALANEPWRHTPDAQPGY